MHTSSSTMATAATCFALSRPLGLLNGDTRIDRNPATRPVELCRIPFTRWVYLKHAYL